MGGRGPLGTPKSDYVICARPHTAKYTTYGILGAYLSALDMVEWGIPFRYKTTTVTNMTTIIIIIMTTNTTMTTKAAI